MSRLEVLAVASEVFPLIKTGGLGDVVGALPGAMAAEDVRVRTLVPGYPSVRAALRDPAPIGDLPGLPGGAGRLVAGTAAGLDLIVLDAPQLFDRPGNPYAGPGGRDWYDNGLRFAALAKAGADIATGFLSGYLPDVVHAHDWQAGLTHAYLFFSGTGPGRVMTIHNLAFQGHFPAELLPLLGLPPQALSIDGIEYHGGISFLKAGLQYADRLTTVSPTYAVEIRTAEQGMGLDGLVRARAAQLTGIVNGIDTAVWDPAGDPHLAARYDARGLRRRAANKPALQARAGLAADPAAPLFGMVSRLTWQKGVDLVLETLPTLLAAGGQFVLLGSGDAASEAAFVRAAADHPGQVAVTIGYDEPLAHQIQAGVDALLMPSRFEPCGLTQLCALRYGAVPVVGRVGGLADTVIDASPVALAAGVATGVQFAPVTAEMLRAAIERTVALFRDGAVWRRLQARGMATDVSWRDPARRYARLFRDLVAARASP